MKVTDYYFQEHNKYKDKYGTKTIVLMEVGSFYEIYSIRNSTENAGPDIRKIGDMLNIQTTRKNSKNKTCDRSNPYMAGFPNYVVEKFTNILLSEDYTVVIIKQKEYGVSNPERFVSQILSPGTNIDSREIQIRKISLLSIYIDEIKLRNGKTKLICAYSGINQFKNLYI